MKKIQFRLIYAANEKEPPKYTVQSNKIKINMNEKFFLENPKEKTKTKN